jgi:hypothetical protein
VIHSVTFGVYFIDRMKGQWAFTDTCRRVLALYQRYRQTKTILIEEAANGPAIVNVLSRMAAGVGRRPASHVRNVSTATPSAAAHSAWER